MRYNFVAAFGDKYVVFKAAASEFFVVESRFKRYDHARRLEIEVRTVLCREREIAVPQPPAHAEHREHAEQRGCHRADPDERIHIRRTVQEILGEGKELSREEPCHAGDMSFSQGLYYPDKRLIVFHEKGIVTGLVLLRGSKLRFERSGLMANDSRKAYARAYRLPQIPEESSRSMTAAYSIAPDENLSFGLNGSYVMLSIYEN